MIIIELEDKLLIAKLTDKIEYCKTSNKIVNTEFLNMYKMQLLSKELNRLKEKNYIFYGGAENSEYKILILYPDKFKTKFEEFFNETKEEKRFLLEKVISNIIKVIRITLPKELKNMYEHRDYLSAIMKFGLTRERIGDIIVNEDGADIIVLKENVEYLKNSLQELTRFKKAQIEILDISQLKPKIDKFEEIKISVSSYRLDSFVSEIVKISRSKAEELINNEKVTVNSKIETKSSKGILEQDIIVIRGKGKFIINEFIGKNRKNKNIVRVSKFV